MRLTAPISPYLAVLVTIFSLPAFSKAQTLSDFVPLPAPPIDTSWSISFKYEDTPEAIKTPEGEPIETQPDRPASIKIENLKDIGTLEVKKLDGSTIEFYLMDGKAYTMIEKFDNKVYGKQPNRDPRYATPQDILSAGFHGAYWINKKCTFEGIEQIRGKECARITRTGTVTIPVEEQIDFDPEEPRQPITRKVDNIAWIDIATGYPVKIQIDTTEIKFSDFKKTNKQITLPEKFTESMQKDARRFRKELRMLGLD